MQPSQTDSPEAEFVKTGASKITEKEIVKVIDKSEEIQKKFYQRGPLARFVEDGRLFLAFVKDYWAKKYRVVPYGIIAAIVFTLIYVFNPLDLIPDILPVIGVVDDATVMGACLLLVEQDLLVYKKWLGQVDKSEGKPGS